MMRRQFLLQTELAQADEPSLEGAQTLSAEERKKQRERVAESLGLLAPKRGANKVRHYHKEPKASRDQFGNKLFSSDKYCYFDNEGIETTAGLLLSPAGEQMVKTNKGILEDIERGILIMTKERHAGTLKNKEHAELGNGRRMTLIMRGGQSQVYRLETGTESYVVKINAATHIGMARVDQPYINEMLQCQALAQDLQEELAAAGISLPTFMFASGKVSCTEFIAGHQPTEAELMIALRKNNLLRKLTAYLMKKHRTDPLWKSIEFDLVNSLNDRLKTDNFIKRDDGDLVWIDPVFYHDPNS